MPAPRARHSLGNTQDGNSSWPPGPGAGGGGGGKRPQFLEGPRNGLEGPPSPEGSGDKPTPPRTPRTV